MLLAVGACLAAPQTSPSVSLHELARRGDAAALEAALVDKSATSQRQVRDKSATADLPSDVSELDELDAYGWTPLFWAVDGGHQEAIKVR
jgi:ankyrin repeat protein